MWSWDAVAQHLHSGARELHCFWKQGTSQRPWIWTFWLDIPLATRTNVSTTTSRLHRVTAVMAPITTHSTEETHAALLDSLDMHKIHKPFRNPNWKPPQRRNKNLKQILSEAQRAQQSLLNTQQNSGATTPQPSTDGTNTPSLNPNPEKASQDLGRLVLEKNAKQSNGIATPMAGISTGPSVTYTSIAAAPSLKPKRKYCDITGLPAKYKDPKSGLYYYNAEIYAVVKGLSTTQVQEYLAARGANTVLK